VDVEVAVPVNLPLARVYMCLYKMVCGILEQHEILRN